MNHYDQTLMQTPDEFLPKERSRRTERRALVIGLFFSYFACLATMWYIWNAPRQAFEMFWFSFGQSRFTLIILPMLVLSIFFFRLRQITGDIIGWGVKNLDERQRMVRDQAHRLAYKIIAFLCLFVPLYLIIQNLFTTPINASMPGVVKLTRLQSANNVQILVWHTEASAQAQSIFIARNAVLNQGIYYTLFLLVLALIVWTLPRAIIAWRERI
jgi:hypothetical protein